MREKIRQLVAAIKPGDGLEAEQMANALEWIDSGVEIFRLIKPNVPPKHLVSYGVLVDQARGKVMLTDHLKSGLWLPAGGHVEKDEHPKGAIEREIQEELSMVADFLNDEPFFLTQNPTVGQTKDAGHIDVSFWYLIKADSTKEIVYDPREFKGYKWFDYDELLQTDITKLDPQMHRFVKKLLNK